MRVVALIPAHQEAARVGETVSALADIPAVGTVVVVDDGSTDDTAAIASRAGATVLRLDDNVGKGGALAAGLRLFGSEADVVLLLDADLGSTASQAGALLDPIVSGDANMTIALLPAPPGSGGFGLVKGLARWGVRRLGGGFEAAAPLSGQRALDRKTVAAVTPLAEGFGVEVALTVRAIQAGLAVEEVATQMAHCHTGKSIAGFAHRARQFVDVARTLGRLAWGRD